MNIYKNIPKPWFIEVIKAPSSQWTLPLLKRSGPSQFGYGGVQPPGSTKSLLNIKVANDPHKSMRKSKELEIHNHLPSSSTTFKASITVQYIPRQSKNICTGAQIQGQDWFSWPGKSLENTQYCSDSCRIFDKAQQNSISLLPLAQILSQEAHFVRC